MAEAQARNKLYISVRFKLLIPFLLIILFVGLFALPAVRAVVASRLEQEVDERLTQSAVSFGLLIDQAKDEAELVASFVANLPDVEAISNDGDLASTVLSPLKDEFDLQELSYYSADYRSGASALYYGVSETDQQNTSTQRAIATRDDLILATIADKSPTSGIVIAPESSQIIAVAPVLQDGVLNGIVVSIFFIDDSYIDDISSILDSDVAIISDNQIVASTSNININLDPLLETQIDLEQVSQSFNITYDDGSQRRLSTNPLIINDEQQGTVIVIHSLADVAAVQGRIQRIVWIFLGVIIGVMLLYSIGVIINFAIPLKRLADAASRVSAGQLDERVEIPYLIEDEVVDLTNNFNGMTERLSGFYIKLEQTVLDRTEELVATLQELEIKRDEALDANKTKSLFLANTSHELRTPLNAIIGYSEMLEEEAEDFGYNNIVPDLRKIQSAGSHLLVLINDILDISKIEAGAIQLYLEDFMLADLIDDIAMSMQPIIQKNGNSIQLEYQNDLGEIHSDSTRIRQILTNLLSNATKFTENGIISIQAKRFTNDNHIEHITLSVMDTGIGMSEQEQAKVFDEFTQADVSTTRKYGGTGLGLPISRHFVTMLGGTITVSSVEGEGSTFTIVMPVRVIVPEKAN